MFESLEKLPDDPILGLAAAARQDINPKKIDMSMGVYLNEHGLCPVFEAVNHAQRLLVEQETSKVYMQATGDENFTTHIPKLVFGDSSSALNDGRIASIQTPGGCGALRLGAEIINIARSGSRVFLSDPSWPVHIPLMRSAGLNLVSYRYYQPGSHSVNFEAMVEDVSVAKAGDVVLLHGCCHNPCGADLSEEQWNVIADMADRQGFLPYIDIAYQGMGDGLEQDASGLRILAERVPEMIVASSCSKNMGLYRERTGATLVLCANRERVEAVISQAKTAARGIYSMPPAHGGILAGMLLSDNHLNRIWREELQSVCERINQVRTRLVNALATATDRDFGFIAREKGMFSFLGLEPEHAVRLRDEFSIYMTESSRINVAAVNDTNLDYLAESIAKVIC